MNMQGARRWWALAASVSAVLVVGLDATVLNVALPTLATGLHANNGDLQWIVAGYTAVFAALLLPAGILGDRYGRRRMLLSGTTLFGIASLVAAEAGSPGQLIAARAVMGVGGAVIMPLSMSIIPSLFGEEERSRAIAITSGAMAAGLPLGPILGGYLLNHFWWGSVFLINVPVAAVSFVLIAVCLPESQDPSAPSLDLAGTLLTVTGLGVMIYGAIRVSAHGWGDPTVLTAIAAGLAFLAVFALRQLRAERPMMDLALFRNRTFLWGTVAATFGSLVMMGGLFMIPQYLQVVLGTDTLGSGLRLVPMILGLMVGGLVSGRLSGRLGIKYAIAAGLTVFAAGFFLAAATGAHDGYGYAAGWLSVIGLATGFTLVPAMDVVLGTLPENQTGVGSGLIQTLRQTGGAFGVAGLGSLLSTLYVDHLPRRAPAPATESVAAAAAIAGRLHDTALLASARGAYVFGMDRVMVVCGAGSLAVLVLLTAFMPRRKTVQNAEPSSDAADSVHDPHESTGQHVSD